MNEPTQTTNYAEDKVGTSRTLDVSGEGVPSAPQKTPPCTCPLTYKFLKPEQHTDTCPVVDGMFIKRENVQETYNKLLSRRVAQSPWKDAI